MDVRSLKVLEYPKILTILSHYCVTDMAKEKVQQLVPMETAADIHQALESTQETVDMMLRNGRPPLSEFPDIQNYVKRANIGSMLSFKELLDIAVMLRVVHDMEDYYYNDAQFESLRELNLLFLDLDPISFLEKEITKKILSPVEMADTASRELSRIRKEINFKNARVTEKLNHIIARSSNEKYLQERIITLRSNRYVVPVKKEYRNMIPGIVLDRSGTGATLFIEPMPVVELNNDLKILAVEEEKEITRILKDLTAKVAVSRENLFANLAILTKLDFEFAKGKYALDINGVKVTIGDQEPIAFFRAKHPLIAADQVVASDIYMEKDINTMIITGPNTGGKTVTLKTIGLLNIMVQSGLFVPVKEGSKTRIFKSIFADIGDEQSIEQNLSTFSSHMNNIVDILDKADENTLVLFDELGAGTDPTEGAALAISILEQLHQRQVMSISTTHYSKLKEYALLTEGIVNASVEFDVKTLRPTYKLLIGVPGKSNAFEIAKRLGLSTSIIEDSKKRIDDENIRFEEMLIHIDEERRKTEATHQNARKIEADAEQMKNEIRKQQIQAEKEAQKIIETAQHEAGKIVEQTRNKTEEIYKDIRLIQENTVSTVRDNKHLESLRKQMKEQEKSIYNLYHLEHTPEGAELSLDNLKVGMKVKVKSVRKEGEILKIKNAKSIDVLCGILKLNVSLEDLQKGESAPKTKKQNKVTIKAADRHVMNAKLDLRGRNAEESLFLVDKMISDAIVSGTKQLIIVHGNGTGKLRQVIHEYLDHSNLIASYRLGARNEGGSGATIVEMA